MLIGLCHLWKFLSITGIVENFLMRNHDLTFCSFSSSVLKNVITLMMVNIAVMSKNAKGTHWNMLSKAQSVQSFASR